MDTLRLLASALPLLALAATAQALDVPLGGASLVMTRRSEGRERLVFRARQTGLPAPDPGSPEDPRAPGDAAAAIVEVVAEGDSATGSFVVPRGAPPERGSAGWSHRRGTYRFRNPAAPAAPSEVSTLVVNGGQRLELVAREVPVRLDGGLGRVAVRITMGGLRYCARFDPGGFRQAQDRRGRYFVPRAQAGMADCSDETLGIPCDPTVRSVAVPDLAAPFGLVYRRVLPQDVDPTTSDFRGSHHEIFVPSDPAIQVRDQLFVFLPGTNNLAAGFSQVLRIAARAGYRSIGLAFDTSVAPQWCSGAGLSGPSLFACSVGFFEEKLYGRPAPNGIAIDEPSSIAGRLLRLLQYLHADDPTLGFDRFFDAGGVRWERVAVGGFSQGAALTGYLAKDQPLARAMFLAGGCDAYDTAGGPQLMPWCHAPRRTPAARTFALMHVRDEPEEDLLIYEAYGLPALGGFGDAAAGSPSYCTAPHVLQTNLPSQGTAPDDHGQKFHLSVAHDEFIPLDGAVAALAEDYYYLLTAE